MSTPTSTPVRGYKVFNPDLTCRGFQFEVGKEFKTDEPIEICKSGFHFCIKASHCFSYYSFNSENKVCEVEAIGDTQNHADDSKICTNHIRIIRMLTWEEVLQVANEGKYNTGHSNTGYRNTGYSNTGDRNTGYRNTGDRNTGNWNTGNWNTGYSNTGNWNTGNWNTGNWNTGNWNTGDRNTGYRNTGDRNTGVFCTGAKHLDFFNKKSDWTEEMFKESKAYRLLCQVETKIWIYPSSMTEEEKQKHPSYKTCDGYLKDIPFKEAFQNQWHNWNTENRSAFTSLPNFDKDIFFEITGVSI